ncbi:hypothetical protein COV17_03370 [Candidatus Woesearchaeota archaeon CG10_big_fil_rev_8_21_14_0_10_36_11]|nr:MAG: hypothetical protein COV17_03370 [Candidatus Woesearchaeota archaeon CG10_big_fil_rev_8_21_14_0_10_36_11]
MTQTFYEHMAQFLRDKDAKDVVEVGLDVQLRLARALSSHCRKFYSVNFSEDHARMQGWYELARDMGGVTNLEFLSGNVLELPNLLPNLIDHADVIILQGVLIDGTGTDTDLMWKYRRGELECDDGLWRELVSRFRQAEEDAYKGFLQVAKPGHIVRFGKPEEDKKFKNMLVDKLRVDPTRIQTKVLLYGDTGNVGKAFFIDNS